MDLAAPPLTLAMEVDGHPCYNYQHVEPTPTRSPLINPDNVLNEPPDFHFAFIKENSCLPKSVVGTLPLSYKRLLDAMLRRVFSAVGARSGRKNVWCSIVDVGWRDVQRGLCTASEKPSEDVVLNYDISVVGAGPAGLAAAIRAKQVAKEMEKDVSVCVIEKGAEVGAHVISGNVLEPRALSELLPEWQSDENKPALCTEVKQDRFYVLSKNRAFRMPTPPQMKNKGNYVISLSELSRWLAGKAEDLGVEVFPGFSGKDILVREDGSAGGIVTTDMGVAKDGSKKATFQKGVVLHAKATLLAEGCRGSISQRVMKRYRLREKAQSDHQTYGLGIKEVWEVPAEVHKEGTVWHTVGYPLDHSTYGGGFLYHMAENKVAVGLVVGLDYSNPYMSPYQEFQKFKMHPSVKKVLENGTCVQYGARSLNEGGLQSIPELCFPGGALIGCSAGFLNVPKIKGTHTAMKSGMLAAETAVKAVLSEKRGLVDLSDYQKALQESWVWEELTLARNIRPMFRFGLWPGMLYAALDTYVLRGGAPWTFKHRHEDRDGLKSSESSTPIEYPKPDGKITFDLTTSLYRSGTNHDHDQPAHLVLKNEGVPAVVNVPIYDKPEVRYCPAGVYEYSKGKNGEDRLQINAQNCVHCKACDIKDPTGNIEWTAPEGGGGPGYTVM